MTVISGEEEKIDPRFEKAEERYAEYQKVLGENLERWKASTSYLEKIPEQHQAAAAMILENERLYLQQEEASPEFSKVALQLIAKIMEGFIVFDLVSIQPILEKEGRVFGQLFKYDSGSLGDDLPSISLHRTSYPAPAKTRRLKLQHHTFPVEELDELAAQIRNEFTREVILDLKNNAGTVAKATIAPDGLDFEKIYVKFVEISGVIFRKTLRDSANWIIVGSKIADILLEKPHLLSGEQNLDGDTQQLGTYCGKYKVFCRRKDFPEYEALLGLKQEFSDYIYAPLVWLIEGPVVLHPDNFDPSRYLFCNYAKKMTSPKSYARLTWETAP